MPTLEEYRQYYSQALLDEATYTEWANSRPDAERKRVYEGYAENRRSDAIFYEKEIQRLERVNGQK